MSIPFILQVLRVSVKLAATWSVVVSLVFSSPLLARSPFDQLMSFAQLTSCVQLETPARLVTFVQLETLARLVTFVQRRADMNPTDEGNAVLLYKPQLAPP